MTIAQSIIIAIVEGITEYIPISSTGHMIITEKLLHLADDDFLKVFTVAIQLGAILAVVVLYYKKFFDFSRWQFYAKLVVAVIPALVIGFLLGPEALGGFLAGATVSGVLMGMFQNNAGGAWDNAKKSFEKGVEINGQIYKKGSDPHKAAVTGDTVGDPFKDTSGPSMNILIKLMSIVSLVLAPTLADFHAGNSADHAQAKKVEKTISAVPVKKEATTAVYIK